MNEHRLQLRPKISRRASHDMILMFAQYGNHGDKTVFRTDADVKRYLAHRGIDFEKLIELCRSFNENVPYFENLVGSTVTNGGSIYVESHDENLIGHFKEVKARLKSKCLCLTLGRETSAAVEVTFETSPEKYTEVKRVLSIMIPDIEL